MITRRNFIQTLGFATAGGAVLAITGSTLGQNSKRTEPFQVPAEILSDPVYSFTSTHFVPFINTDFQIRRVNSKRADLVRLHSVKDFESKLNDAAGVTGDCFSLMFFSPRGTRLPAGQYEFSHFSLGTFNLTLLPISADPNRYEAIINHLKPLSSR